MLRPRGCPRATPAGGTPGARQGWWGQLPARFLAEGDPSTAGEQPFVLAEAAAPRWGCRRETPSRASGCPLAAVTPERLRLGHKDAERAEMS